MNPRPLLQPAFSLPSMRAVCLIALLMALSSGIHASTPDATVSSSRHNDALSLSQPNTRYALANMQHSSGFVAAPEGSSLEEAPDVPPETERFDLKPNFNKYNRYWLYTHIVNDTENSDWVLHISNFGFQNPKVLIRGTEGQTVRTLSNAGYKAETDINTLGRGTEIALQPGRSYLMIVELTAPHVAWHPYIALMGRDYYQSWTTEMDFAFKLGVGMILGMILLGAMCWLLLAEKTFFWAALSSLLMLIYYLEHSSVPAILWQSDYEKTKVFFTLVSSTLLSLLAFAASFLQIGRQSGLWYRVFVGAALATAAIYLIAMFLPFRVNVGLYAFNYLLVSLVIISSGVAKMVTHGHYYIIYLLGWLPMLLSLIQVVATLVLPGKAIQEVSVSYKMIQVLYIQIAHMVVHAAALVLRIRALREEKLRMEFLSQAKSRFIAQSSHDLSQPLNSMNLFLDSLKPHIRVEEGKSIYDRLRTTHRQMADSFSSIMDLSKLESGVVKPDVQTVSILTLFARLENDYRPVAAQKNLSLRFHACSADVLSDPVLLERMLRNLVSNALKYTESGRVIVGCRRRGQNLAIEIMDTGCGISENDKTHIFDIYRRSETGLKQAEGSGIGLSIVKHLSALLGHPVTMTSTPDKGSRFSVLVPRVEGVYLSRQLCADTEREPPTAALVFADKALEREVSQRLTRWGWLPQSVSALNDLPHVHTPSLLLCDFATLEHSALPPEDINRLPQTLVAGCICSPSTVLPAHWIALTTPLLPSQLRATLNFALRRQHSTPGAQATLTSHIAPTASR